jgi:nitrogen fixation/metabolism regulation signal transduction histidine kinase
MTDAKVGRLLFLSILVMAVVPLTAAFWLLEDTLETSLNLGFNAPVVQALEDAATNLRTLGKLDEANRAGYRAQFEAIDDLKQVYSNPELIKSSLENSLKLYFGLGLGTTLLLAVAVATLLSRSIARGYRQTFDELARQREHVRYLEEMSSWQEMAKMLAHEIKNPLTPIEVLVTSLTKSFSKKSAEEFREQLAQTERMIGEELGHLKNTVVKFSEFARLPQVALIEADLEKTVAHHASSLAQALDAPIDVRTDTTESIRVGLDVTLFRQVMANIVRNGIEANPDRRVSFSITLSGRGKSAAVRIENDGVPIAATLASRVFDPYVSTKSGSQNMGLGLAIVKKIVIEHGGEIEYVERDGRPGFLITLPRVK